MLLPSIALLLQPMPFCVSLCFYVFCNNKWNISGSHGAHSLITLCINSAYVRKLTDGRKKSLFAPHVPGHNCIWSEYVSDPLELKCHHFHSGGRLEPFKITDIASAPGEWKDRLFTSFLHPWETSRKCCFL